MNVQEDYTTGVMRPHEFLTDLYRGVPEGWLELTYLAPDGVDQWPKTLVNWARLPLEYVPADMPTVHRYNAAGYGCYFGVAVRGVKHDAEQRTSKRGKPYTFYPRGKAHDATYITALWVDVDIPGDDGLQRILSLDAPPSVIISSGGGWHGYWFLYEPFAIHDGNRDGVIRTLRGLALACDGDTAVADLARIMRLPGTINTKPGRGTECRIVDSIPWRVRYEEMELAYAPYAAPPKPEITRHIPTPSERHIPPWVEQYIQHGAVQGERNSTLNRMAWSLFNDGFSRHEVEGLLTGRALSDGLDQYEIERTIDSAQRAKRGAPSIEPNISKAIAADDHLLRYRGNR